MNPQWMRLFKGGVWTGNPDRTIRVNGFVYDLDEYAKEQGITLPDWEINSYEDLDEPFRSGDTEQFGTGDSQSEE